MVDSVIERSSARVFEVLVGAGRPVLQTPAVGKNILLRILSPCHNHRINTPVVASLNPEFPARSSLHPSMAAQLKQWCLGSEFWFGGGELEVAM